MFLFSFLRAVHCAEDCSPWEDMTAALYRAMACILAAVSGMGPPNHSAGTDALSGTRYMLCLAAVTGLWLALARRLSTTMATIISSVDAIVGALLGRWNGMGWGRSKNRLIVTRLMRRKRRKVGNSKSLPHIRYDYEA